jgi:hypothetical protein
LLQKRAAPAVFLFFKSYGSYEFLHVHSLTTTQCVPTTRPKNHICITHSPFNVRNASRSRQRYCVVVKTQRFFML